MPSPIAVLISDVQCTACTNYYPPERVSERKCQMANAQRKQSIRSPIAVVTSDIHFNIQTLDLASAALYQAIDKANRLQVRLIIAGDMHDQKANVRGECIKAIMDLLEECNQKPIVIVSNHDRINEKSKEHSLEFVRGIAHLITEPEFIEPYGYILPYYHDSEELRAYLKTLPKNSRLIMHQGVQGSNSGEYIQDKSAITTNDVCSFRIISGHYHTRQTIKLNGGQWDYIGNPYTLTFAEANDPEKGFQVLYDDGSLEFIPTNLRKHVIVELTADKTGVHSKKLPTIEDHDLVWVKIEGTKEYLSKITKEQIKTSWVPMANFKLDLIPTIVKSDKKRRKTRTSAELLDSMIDGIDTTENRKIILKDIWKSL